MKTEQEIERLKDDYAKLQELFANYQIASDKEMIAHIKQAKINVLNELKNGLSCIIRVLYRKSTNLSRRLRNENK